MSGVLTTAIDAERLVKTYEGGIEAVRGISLRVPAGMVFGLLGPEGAGKSTVVMLLSALTAPTSGRATVAGYDIVREQGRVRQSIGCVAQQSGVDPHATGRENLTLQGGIHGLRGRQLALRVADLLDLFGLTDSAERPAETYSGGMKRKLDVAMGLVHEPAVLFLDEPTVGLDPEARAELWEQIRELAWDRGLTILLTTHQLEEAEQLAHRLAIVDRGLVVAEGTPDELKARLDGDAITLELAGEADAEQARTILSGDGIRGGARDGDRGVGFLGEVMVEGRTVRARAADGASSVPGVLGALGAAGVRVTAVTVARPSLG